MVLLHHEDDVVDILEVAIGASGRRAKEQRRDEAGSGTYHSDGRKLAKL